MKRPSIPKLTEVGGELEMRPRLFHALCLMMLVTRVTGQDAITTSVSLSPGVGVTTALPGPWGQLDYYQIPLDCPGEFYSTFILPSQQVEWTIPAASHEELQNILSRARLTGTEIAELLSNSSIIKDQEIFRIFPKEEMLLGIQTETRMKLYSLLSEFDENRFHRHPLYIASENLSDWFQGTDIPRSTIEDIALLTYPTPSGRGYYFSDAPFTLKRAASVRDEEILFRGLFRKRGLIVRLRLSGDSPTSEIADYWTAGYKNKAVMPLLESVVQSNDGGAIDIAHLLPATPRVYLNRFPDISDGVSGRFPDWFWTCYNFFRFTPRDVYADSPERDRLVLNEFETGLPPNEFGDMLLLNSGGRIIHGCIHIAEDIVYTKNGQDLNSPWVFMKIQDVVAFHDLYGDVSISTFRKRQPSGPVIP